MENVVQVHQAPFKPNQMTLFNYVTTWAEFPKGFKVTFKDSEEVHIDHQGESYFIHKDRVMIADDFIEGLRELTKDELKALCESVMIMTDTPEQVAKDNYWAKVHREYVKRKIDLGEDPSFNPKPK